MPTFFDVMTTENIDITDSNAIFYLISVDEAKPEENKYCIKGLCIFPEDKKKFPDDFSADPYHRAKQYWPVNKEDLIFAAKKDEHKDILFPGGELTTQTLSLQQIKTYLNLNPLEEVPRLFNHGVGISRVEEWASSITDTFQSADPTFTREQRRADLLSRLAETRRQHHIGYSEAQDLPSSINHPNPLFFTPSQVEARGAALSRERFRDVPVSEIDSPTREANGPGHP